MAKDSQLQEPIHCCKTEEYLDLMDACQRLKYTFRKRVAETNLLRELTKATCDDIKINKIAKILQPQIFSGLEAPLESMIDVLIPIAEGCGSTSWVLAQYIMHNYMIARWPEQAQREVWDVNPDALVSGILIPRLGKGNVVNDGMEISGHWPWVTGISSADWCILSAIVQKDDKELECYFLIPTSEVRVIDTWRAIGLKGTGSHDVVVDKLFVPKHRIVEISDFKGGNFSGSSLNRGKLYRPPVYMTFGILLTSSVIGMVKSMLTEYLQTVIPSITTMSGTKAGSFQSQQIRIAEIQGHLNAAETLLRSDSAEILRRAEDPGYAPDAVERSRYRSNAAYAGRRAYEAALSLWDLAGAKAAYQDSDIGRIFLDILVATRHVTQGFDNNATDFGRASVGLSLTNPSL